MRELVMRDTIPREPPSTEHFIMLMILKLHDDAEDADDDDDNNEALDGHRASNRPC